RVRSVPDRNQRQGVLLLRARPVRGRRRHDGDVAALAVRPHASCDTRERAARAFSRNSRRAAYLDVFRDFVPVCQSRRQLCHHGRARGNALVLGSASRCRYLRRPAGLCVEPYGKLDVGDWPVVRAGGAVLPPRRAGHHQAKDCRVSLLNVQNVSRHFGSLVAVDDVSMSVQSGELRAVIGPNGAGKTTFFNLISGLLPPTSGKILLDDRDITPLSPQQRVALGVARTFQITEVFPELSVRENLRIPVESAAGLRLRPWLSPRVDAEVSRRVAEFLKMGGLATKAERLAGELPHGDQRATEIMMALALRPRLLLLDEPTAGMGDQETYDITRLVRRLHRD